MIRPTARLPILLVFFLLVLVGMAPAKAGINTWTSEGPWGGAVVALGQDPVDPQVLYAASVEAGMWKSLDGGESWLAISEGLSRSQRQILAMAVHPGTTGILLIHVPGSPRLLLSSDGGESWTGIGPGFSGLFIGAIEYAPSDGDTVYLGAGGAVWVSHDGGFAWQMTSPDFSDSFISHLAIHPTDPSTLYALDQEGSIFATNDGGATWRSADEGIPTDSLGSLGSLSIDTTTPSTLYAAVRDRLVKSTDAGEHWTVIDTAIHAVVDTVIDDSIRRVAIDPRTPSHVYAGTVRNGIFRSTDGGSTWTQGTFDHSETRITDFAFGPPDTDTVYLAEGLDGGIFRSDDGLTWHSSNQGLGATRVKSFTLDPTTSTLYAAAANGIHRRPRNLTAGDAWELLPASRRHGKCCSKVLVDPENPQILYAGGENSGILRSHDGGDTWTVLNGGDPKAFLPGSFVMDPKEPSTLYVANGSGVWKSTDRGDTWSVDSAPAQARLLAFDPFDPERLLVATTLETWESVDDGETWTLLGDAPGGFPTAMFFDPLLPGALYGATSSEVTRSGNGGSTWFALGTEGLPSSRAIETLTLDPRDKSTLYAGTLSGLHVSRDGGMTWSLFEGGVDPEKWVISLLIDPGPPATFHAGTFRNSGYSLTRGCIDGPEVLCLDRQAADKRFAVSIDFDTTLGGGLAGAAETTSLESLGIDDGGIFSFFTPENPEALVKVVDACGFNDRFWVFSAATTSVGFDLTVEDTLTRERRTYSNPDDHPAESIADIDAFATCDAEPLGGAVTPTASITPTKPRTVSPRPPHLEARSHDTGGCVADATTLCIDDAPGDARFAIRLHFDSALGGGAEGDAMATPLAPLGITDGGILSFFDTSLPEVLVKVIDGCGFNGHYWLFYAATTNLGFTLTLEDTHTGETRTYTNPDAMIAETVTDIDALPTCDGT